MNFIHKNGMMHRDIKVENIILNEFFDAKLVDFSLAKITESVLDDDEYAVESNEEDYTNKTNVYSFGVVLHFIFTGKLPNQFIKDKLIGTPVVLPSPSESISSFCIDLISKYLEKSASKSTSFEDILDIIRENSYKLADNINQLVLKKRDDELSSFDIKK